MRPVSWMDSDSPMGRLAFGGSNRLGNPPLDDSGLDGPPHAPALGLGGQFPGGQIEGGPYGPPHQQPTGGPQDSYSGQIEGGPYGPPHQGFNGGINPWGNPAGGPFGQPMQSQYGGFQAYPNQLGSNGFNQGFSPGQGYSGQFNPYLLRNMWGMG